MVTGCEVIPSPQAYRIPSFSYVGFEIIKGDRPGLDDKVVLTAELSGNYGITECGFRWGVDDWRLSEASIKTFNNSIVLSLEGLQVNTVYYCHAFIRNGNSDICSDRIFFKTNRSEDNSGNKDEVTDNPDPDNKPGARIVNFSDRAFKSYALSLCDSDSDGEVSVEEALTVENMDLCTDGVSDVFGIGAFSNLKTLSCCGSLWNGSLTELNISGDIRLESICCKYNRLSFISFPTDNRLEYLDCDFNELHNADFSSLSELKVLHCYGNKFENISLKGMDSLEELYCGYNYIYSLDVSSNPKLKVLDVTDCVNLKTIYVAHGQKIENIIAPNSVKIEYVNN